MPKTGAPPYVSVAPHTEPCGLHAGSAGTHGPSGIGVSGPAQPLQVPDEEDDDEDDEEDELLQPGGEPPGPVEPGDVSPVSGAPPVPGRITVALQPASTASSPSGAVFENV